MNRAWEALAVAVSAVLVARLATTYIPPALPYLVALLVIAVVARWALFPPTRW